MTLSCEVLLVVSLLFKVQDNPILCCVFLTQVLESGEPGSFYWGTELEHKICVLAATGVLLLLCPPG